MANDYLLQEDGTSKILLESGTFFVILESSGAASSVNFKKTLSAIGTKVGTKQVQGGN